MTSSSFQRKTKSRLPSIPGVFPSIYTNQQVVSTGVPDLDSHLGGGLPLGSLLTIVEDKAGSYAKLLLKYFLSEGLVHNHSLMVSSSTGNLVENLPSFESVTEQKDDKNIDEKMIIAWRYQQQSNTKQLAAQNNNKAGHTFNLLKNVPVEVINERDVSIADFDSLVSDGDGRSWRDSPFSQLIRKIHKRLTEGGFLLNPNNPPSEHQTVLRLGLQSLGGLVWGPHLATFLLSLRAMLRSSLCVAVVTIPSSVTTMASLETCSDFMVQLESFDGKLDGEISPAYRDYHGLINLVKLSSLGSLGPPTHMSGNKGELVFKSRRTKFTIERFSLPPDLSETVSRDNKDKGTIKATDIEF